MSDKIKNKIDKFFREAKWKINEKDMQAEASLAKELFEENIKKYSSEPSKDKKLIKAYLSQSRNRFYNDDELTVFLYQLAPDEFTAQLKFNKSFEHGYFEELINPLRDKIEDFLREIEIIKTEQEKSNNLKNEIERELSSFDLYELLFKLAVWNDEAYFTFGLKNAPLNPAYVQALSLLINIFQPKIINQADEIIKADKMQERFYAFLKYYANHYEKWAKFKGLMSKALDVVKWDTAYETYCFQNARLIRPENKDFYILPKGIDDELSWQKSGEIQEYLERFYRNEAPLGLKSNPFYARKTEMKFNGIPDEIPFTETNLDVSHVLWFFESLSAFHSSRYYERVESLTGENPDDNIFQIILKATEEQNLLYKPLMGAINFTDSDYLIKRISRKTSFEIQDKQAELRTIIDMLSYDLKGEKDDWFNLLEQPFLKINGTYIYFSTLAVVNNPAFYFENRLLKQKERKHYEQIISKNFESLIADIFKKNNFETLTGIEIPESPHNKKTEIDVLAVKNDELLVIQAKKTYRRITVSAAEHFNPQLEKAAEQTEDSLQYIKHYTESFLEKHDIQIKPENLKLYGLIVSNTTEGSFKRYGNNYCKITPAELAIILEDKKTHIIDWKYEAYSLYLNSPQKAKELYPRAEKEILRAALIISEEKLKEKYDSIAYWHDKDKNISNLLKAVEEEYLWHDILTKQIDFPDKDASREELHAYKLFWAGKRYFDAKNYTAAVNIFEEAVRLNPDDKDTLMHYADSLAEIGEKQKAIDVYTKLTEKHPNCWLVYNNRAASYLDMKEWESAYADFIRSYELNQSNIQALINILYLSQRLKYEFPELPESKEFIRLLEETEDEKAKEALTALSMQNVVKLESKKKNGNLRLKETLELINGYMPIAQAMNDFSEPLNVVSDALRKHPGNAKLLLYKSWIYKAQGKIKESQMLCKKSIARNKNDSEAWRILGELFLIQDDLPKAQEHVEKALKINNNDYYAHYLLGLIFANQKQTDKAVDSITTALNTDNPKWIIEFSETLSKICEAADDTENAMKFLTKAIEHGRHEHIAKWEKMFSNKIKTTNEFESVYYY